MIRYEIIFKYKNRKFITKTARTQKQTILCFRDPFKLVPVNDIAEIADKFTRNEIMTKNEFRQIIGMKPSDDPKADMLINSNISQSPEVLNPNGINHTDGQDDVPSEENTQTEEIDDQTIREVLNTLNDEQKRIVGYLLDN